MGTFSSVHTCSEVKGDVLSDDSPSYHVCDVSTELEAVISIASIASIGDTFFYPHANSWKENMRWCGSYLLKCSSQTAPWERLPPPATVRFAQRLTRSCALPLRLSTCAIELHELHERHRSALWLRDSSTPLKTQNLLVYVTFLLFGSSCVINTLT